MILSNARVIIYRVIACNRYLAQSHESRTFNRIKTLLPSATGASWENGERHTRAEPERSESEEQLSRADGVTTRAREDASVLHGGTLSSSVVFARNAVPLRVIILSFCRRVKIRFFFFFYINRKKPMTRSPRRSLTRNHRIQLLRFAGVSSKFLEFLQQVANANQRCQTDSFSAY